MPTPTKSSDGLSSFGTLPGEALVDVELVADLFSVSQATIWRWSRSRTIPSPVRQGGVTRWRVSDLREHIRAAA